MAPVRIARVKHVADDTAGAFGCRTVKVIVRRGKDFTTPTKPISHWELRHRAETPEFRGVLPGHIAIFPVYVKGKIFEEYCQSNGRVNKIYEDVALRSESSSFLPNVAIIDSEPMNPRKPEAMITLSKQLHIPTLSAVCMPTLNTDAGGFDTTLREWMDVSEGYGKGVVPQISMDEPLNAFRMKLDTIAALAQSESISMVDFVYKDPGKYQLQYSELWSRRHDLGVMLNCSSVPRDGRALSMYMKEIARYDLSMYGFDSITHKRGYPSRPPSQTEPISMGETWGYKWSNVNVEARLDGNRWEAIDPEHAHCDCAICKGMEQREIMERYAYNVEGEIMDAGFMGRISNLHDHLSSFDGVDSIKRAIVSGEVKEFAESIDEKRKTFLKTAKFGEIREFPKKGLTERNSDLG